MKCGIRFTLYLYCFTWSIQYLSFYELDDTYKKIAQDVINMPHVKSSVKRILHFMVKLHLSPGPFLQSSSIPKNLRTNGLKCEMNLKRCYRQRRFIKFIGISFDLIWACSMRKANVNHLVPWSLKITKVFAFDQTGNNLFFSFFIDFFIIILRNVCYTAPESLVPSELCFQLRIRFSSVSNRKCAVI
jgi:hypothetical protein